VARPESEAHGPGLDAQISVGARDHERWLDPAEVGMDGRELGITAAEPGRHTPDLGHRATEPELRRGDIGQPGSTQHEPFGDHNCIHPVHVDWISPNSGQGES